MKSAGILMVVLSMYVLTHANQPEEAQHFDPVKIYSGGVAAGVALPANEQLQDLTRSFATVGVVNQFVLRKNLNLFIDGTWYGPESNFGLHFGIDILAAPTDFRPFVGAGIGAGYIQREDLDFSELFGPSVTAHLGMLVRLSETVRIQIRLPYTVVVSQQIDHMAGFELGFVFNSKFSFIQKQHN